MLTDSAAAAIHPLGPAPLGASPLANYSNVMLADQLGDIDAELKALEQRQKAARDEMTRRQLNSIEGARYIVVKAVKTSMRFDVKSVIAAMGQAWYDGHKTSSSSTTYSVIRKADSEAPVAAGVATVAADVPPVAPVAAGAAPVKEAAPSAKRTKAAGKAAATPVHRDGAP